MMLPVIRAMLRHRALSFLVLLASVGVAGSMAAKIRVRFQYRDFYAYDANKDYPTFLRYSSEFGDPGGNVVVLLQADDVFRGPYLQYIADLSRDLRPSPLFSHVRSLSTVHLVRAVDDGVETGPIMETVPSTPEGIARLRKTALGSKLLSRRLVSEDGTMTAVLAEMRTPAAIATVAQEKEAIEAVEQALAKRPPPPGLQLTLTGAPSIEVSATHALLTDQIVLTPVVVAIISIALVFIFRSLLGVLLVLSTVTVSIVWTAGIFALIGRPVDIVGSIIPTTLLVYGVVDPIFVLTRYLQRLKPGGDRDATIVEALSDMLIPCFLTSLTTALGFAAFVTASMPTVRYLGIVVGIGILFSFVTTITVLPLLLSAVTPPKRALSSQRLHRVLDAFLERSWRFLNAHRGAALVCAVGLVAAGAIVGRSIPIDDAYIDTAPDGPARRAARLTEQKLSGVVRYIVYFEGAPGSMKLPEVVRAMAAVDAAAERDPIVNTSTSLPDLLAEMNQAFEGGAAAARQVPTSASLIAQYLTLIDPDDRADFINDDASQSHIRILATDKGGVESKRFGAYLARVVAQQGFDRVGIRASITGNGVVTYRELERIVVEILWGFVIAFGIVLVFELVIFRSVTIPLISILPNLVPIGACFLSMRLSHVGFRLDTSLVLCVSIGGLFNTTIHLVARMRLLVRSGVMDPDEIVERSLRSVGPASFYTAAILSLGFSALLLSSFPGLRALGGFAVITMITAFFSDAMFTTTSMRVFYRWRSAIARSGTREPLPETAVRDGLEGAL
jgi:predicted RND superfamily exporter protein